MVRKILTVSSLSPHAPLATPTHHSGQGRIDEDPQHLQLSASLDDRPEVLQFHREKVDLKGVQLSPEVDDAANAARREVARQDGLIAGMGKDSLEHRRLPTLFTPFLEYCPFRGLGIQRDDISSRSQPRHGEAPQTLWGQLQYVEERVEMIGHPSVATVALVSLMAYWEQGSIRTSGEGSLR